METPALTDEPFPFDFPQGDPPTESPPPSRPKGGRPRGSKTRRKLPPNSTVKEILTEAFEQLGGLDGLIDWGTRNRDAFYRLFAQAGPKERPGRPMKGGGPTPRNGIAVSVKDFGSDG